MQYLAAVSNKLLAVPSAAQFISNYNPWEAPWNCPMTWKNKNIRFLSRICQVSVHSLFHFSDCVDQSYSECTAHAASKLFNTSYQLLILIVCNRGSIFLPCLTVYPVISFLRVTRSKTLTQIMSIAFQYPPHFLYFPYTLL